MVEASNTAIGAGVTGGVVHAGIIIALLASGGHPTVETVSGLLSFGVTGFTLGFVALFVAGHTRLVTPAAGLLSVLLVTFVLEVTSPDPQWSVIDGRLVVDGPTYALNYANSLYVWLALLLSVGVLEFGVRRGYDIRERELRNLPDLPLAREEVAWIVAGSAGLLGLTTTVFVYLSGVSTGTAVLMVLAFTVCAAAVPIIALLVHGIVLPSLLFGVFVPYTLAVEVLGLASGRTQILFLGPAAIVFAIASVGELVYRERVSDWDGGRFAASRPD